MALDFMAPVQEATAQVTAEVLVVVIAEDWVVAVLVMVVAGSALVIAMVEELVVSADLKGVVIMALMGNIQRLLQDKR